MDWFYALNGRQQGPVSDAELDELLRTNRIHRDTLVWRGGMSNWQPLRLARPGLLAPSVIGGPGMAACVECRHPFPESEMVFLNNSWVCARCKPVFLQRIMEGTAPAAGARGTIWRYRRQLVVRSETALPDLCVRCNAPANGYRLKRQLYWHAPAYYLLIILGLFVCLGILAYLIVALIVRKRATLYVGLCETHRAQRKWFIIGSWLATLIGLSMVFIGIGESIALVGFAGLFLFLGGLLVAGLKVPVISAAKIDKDFAWIKGAGEEFLANFPEWSGP